MAELSEADKRALEWTIRSGGLIEGDLREAVELTLTAEELAGSITCKDSRECRFYRVYNGQPYATAAIHGCPNDFYKSGMLHDVVKKIVVQILSKISVGP